MTMCPEAGRRAQPQGAVQPFTEGWRPISRAASTITLFVALVIHAQPCLVRGSASASFKYSDLERVRAQHQLHADGFLRPRQAIAEIAGALIFKMAPRPAGINFPLRRCR